MGDTLVLSQAHVSHIVVGTLSRWPTAFRTCPARHRLSVVIIRLSSPLADCSRARLPRKGYSKVPQPPGGAWLWRLASYLSLSSSRTHMHPAAFLTRQLSYPSADGVPRVHHVLAGGVGPTSPAGTPRVPALSPTIVNRERTSPRWLILSIQTG